MKRIALMLLLLVPAELRAVTIAGSDLGGGNLSPNNGDIRLQIPSIKAFKLRRFRAIKVFKQFRDRCTVNDGIGVPIPVSMIFRKQHALDRFNAVSHGKCEFVISCF